MYDQRMGLNQRTNEWIDPPSVSAAVLEAEQLRAAARQAAAEAAGCRFGEWNEDEDEDGGGGGGGGAGNNGAGDDDDAAAGALGAAPFGARQAEARAAAEAKKRAETDAASSSSSSASDGGGGPSAKVLAVTPTRAVMFVPGAGVRPFHFAHVFSPEATQDAVYADAARGSAGPIVYSHTTFT